MRRKRRSTDRARRGPPAAEEVGPVLDLHGETAEEARRSTERWLRGLRAEGILGARVVTGRGRRSAGQPVLLGEIGDLLAGLSGELVSSYRLDAGGGAFLVDLRPAPPRRGGGRAGGPAGSAGRGGGGAELRRRAEESLAELGITPTETLVRAEMRRLSGG